MLVGTRQAGEERWPVPEGGPGWGAEPGEVTGADSAVGTEADIQAGGVVGTVAVFCFFFFQLNNVFSIYKLF